MSLFLFFLFCQWLSFKFCIHFISWCSFSWCKFCSRIKNCALVSSEIERYKSIIKKGKKHNQIVFLAKTKLNTIEVLISKVLIDLNISHDQFILVIVYLCIYLCICLSIYLSIYLSVFLYIYLLKNKAENISPFPSCNIYKVVRL